MIHPPVLAGDGGGAHGAAPAGFLIPVAPNAAAAWAFRAVHQAVEHPTCSQAAPAPATPTGNSESFVRSGSAHHRHRSEGEATGCWPNHSTRQHLKASSSASCLGSLPSNSMIAARSSK